MPAPRIPELSAPVPVLPPLGTWLVPAIGVAVPALVGAAFLALQLLGGAAGLRMVRRTLDRVAAAAPRWSRP